MSRLRARFSFANVLAALALFVALGGTGYAALKLPANSVGTAQLKSGSVTSAKVKDHSLKTIDFGAAQLKSGPAGATGAQGPPGPKGDQGAQGPAGPSDAWYAYRIAYPALAPSTTTTIITLANLAPGSYLIIGKVALSDANAGARVQQCDLQAGNFDSEGVVTNVIGSSGAFCSLETATKRTLVPFDVTLSITTAAGSAIQPGSAQITAVRLGSLELRQVTG